ncbi:MAG: glycosyltransferase, partial [Cyanobacteria bacterium J06648_11]
PKGLLVRYTLHQLRMWDVTSSNGVDFFVANSKFVGQRIKRFYRRDSEIIYPPVAVSEFTLEMQKDDIYLAVSRLVSYKNMHLIVEAFKGMPEKKLVIIGDGPEAPRLQNMAAGTSNIELLGQQPFAVLKKYMQKAKAFVFAGKEDFGIVIVEAQACGTPVIAYGCGGALETVKALGRSDKPTGLFFDRPEADEIASAVRTFEKNIDQFSPVHCRENALRFSVEQFRANFSAFVCRCLQERDMSIPDTIAPTRESVLQ